MSERKTTASKPLDARRLVSAAFLAGRWGCSPNTVRRIAAKEKITCFCLGGEGGTVRYDLDSVEEYESRCRV